MSETNIKIDFIRKTTDELARMGVDAFCTSIGFSGYPIAASLLRAVFSTIIENGVVTVFNDVGNRQLSTWQQNKVIDMFVIAQNRYLMRVSKDKNYVTDSTDYTAEQIYEYVEGLILKAMNENQRHKIKVMGNFLGETMYSGNFSQVHKFQQISNTLAKLSWRQVVLIKLISEGFYGYDTTLVPQSHSAAIEINELQQYGFWQSEGAMFSLDYSRTFPLKDIKATDYCQEFVKETGMDIITIENKSTVMNSLQLATGVSPETYTREELKPEWSNIEIESEEWGDPRDQYK